MTRPTSHIGHWLNRGILALLGIVLTLFGAGVLGWSLGSGPLVALGSWSLGRGPLVPLGRVVSLAVAIGLLSVGLHQLYRAATGRFPVWFSDFVLHVGGLGASGGPKAD